MINLHVYLCKQNLNWSCSFLLHFFRSKNQWRRLDLYYLLRRWLFSEGNCLICHFLFWNNQLNVKTWDSIPNDETIGLISLWWLQNVISTKYWLQYTYLNNMVTEIHLMYALRTWPSSLLIGRSFWTHSRQMP